MHDEIYFLLVGNQELLRLKTVDCVLVGYLDLGRFNMYFNVMN